MKKAIFATLLVAAAACVHARVPVITTAAEYRCQDNSRIEHLIDGYTGGQFLKINSFMGGFGANDAYLLVRDKEMHFSNMLITVPPAPFHALVVDAEKGKSMLFSRTPGDGLHRTFCQLSRINGQAAGDDMKTRVSDLNAAMSLLAKQNNEAMPHIESEYAAELAYTLPPAANQTGKAAPVVPTMDAIDALLWTRRHGAGKTGKPPAAVKKAPPKQGKPVK